MPILKSAIVRWPVCICAALVCLSFRIQAFAESGCRFHEVPRTDRSDLELYEGPSLLWSATVDELGGEVTIANKQTGGRCKIEVSSVRRVYAGGSTVALRSIEIASDDIFYFDAATCKEVKSASHLGVSRSMAISDRKAKRLGLCGLVKSRQ
jgi:hypothetical protein